MVRSVRGFVFSGTPKGNALGSLLLILQTSELFHIAGNHIAGYVDDSTIYAVIPIPLSRPQVMESVNQDLAAMALGG